MLWFNRKYVREIAHFVQLSSKLGRRLGIARSRARQAEIDRDWWKTRAQENAATTLEFRDSNQKLQLELAQYKRAVNRAIDTKLTESETRKHPGYNIPINCRPGA